MVNRCYIPEEHLLIATKISKLVKLHYNKESMFGACGVCRHTLFVFRKESGVYDQTPKQTKIVRW